MPFVNNKLGNGFRIKVADSSRDQEHYFGGHLKHIEMSLKGKSVSFDSLSREDFQSGSDTGSVMIRDLAVNNAGIIVAVGVFSGNLGTTAHTSSWVTCRSLDGGQTYSTVDYYTGTFEQVGPNVASNEYGPHQVVADADGNFYAVGCVLFSSSYFAAVARKSVDGGASWSDFRVDHSGGFRSQSGSDIIRAVAVDPGDTNRIFFAYRTQQGFQTGSEKWKIERTTDGGSTYEQVLTYSGSTTFKEDSDANPSCLFISGSTVLCGGFSDTNFQSFVHEWATIMASFDSGTSWELVEDSFSASFPSISPGPLYGLNGRPRAFTALSDGTLFVAGGAQTSNWVLSSSEGGISGSWGLVLNNFDVGGLTPAGTYYQDIAVDERDNIYVVGATGSVFIEEANASYICLGSAEGGRQGTWKVLDRLDATADSLAADHERIATAIVSSGSGTGNRMLISVLTGSGEVFFAYDSPPNGRDKFATFFRSVQIPFVPSNQTSIFMSQSGEVFLTKDIRDSSNAPLDAESFVSPIFGLDPSVSELKPNLIMSYKVSSSVDFDPYSGDWLVEFRDNVSGSIWQDYRDTKEFGSYFDVGGGFFEYKTIFSGSSKNNPLINYDGSVVWKITTFTGSTFQFLDFRIEFDQPITDGGTEFYRSIENQFIEFKFLNPAPLKDIED